MCGTYVVMKDSRYFSYQWYLSLRFWQGTATTAAYYLGFHWSLSCLASAIRQLRQPMCLLIMSRHNKLIRCSAAFVPLLSYSLQASYIHHPPCQNWMSSKKLSPSSLEACFRDLSLTVRNLEELTSYHLVTKLYPWTTDGSAGVHCAVW